MRRQRVLTERHEDWMQTLSGSATLFGHACFTSQLTTLAIPLALWFKLPEFISRDTLSALKTLKVAIGLESDFLLECNSRNQRPAAECKKLNNATCGPDCDATVTAEMPLALMVLVAVAVPAVMSVTESNAVSPSVPKVAKCIHLLLFEDGPCSCPNAFGGKNSSAVHGGGR